MAENSPIDSADLPANTITKIEVNGQVYLGEDAVRHLLIEAVDLARNRSSSGNVCDEAVVQWIMGDRLIPDVGWRSKHFLPLKGEWPTPSTESMSLRSTA